MPFTDFRLEDVTFRLMDFATPTSWLFPEQKRPVHPGNRNRHQFNRQEHATHDGIGGWRGEDEMHTKKFGSLTWRGFPRREQDRQYQSYDHAVEDGEIELIGRSCAKSGSWPRLCGPVKRPTALSTEPIDLWL